MTTTITFEAYIGSPKAWTAIGTNKPIFTGVGSIPMVVGEYQDEIHIVNGSSVDQCAGGHVTSCKYLSASQFVDEAGDTYSINNTTLTELMATMRIVVTSDVKIAITKPIFFAYGMDHYMPAEGYIIQATEINRGSKQWTPINRASKNIGGRANALLLSDRSAALVHYFYLALSVAPEALITSNIKFSFIRRYSEQ